MLALFKSQLIRYLYDDGRGDIDFEPRQAKLTTAQHKLIMATDEFSKALGELQDELLMHGRTLN